MASAKPFGIFTFAMLLKLSTLVIFVIPAIASCKAVTSASVNSAVFAPLKLYASTVFFIAFAMYYTLVNDVDVVLQIYKMGALISSVPILARGMTSGFAGERLKLAGINSNFLGSAIAIALLILIYQMLKKRGSIIGNCIQFGILSIVILISGSRTALIMLAICLFVLFVFRQSKKIIINSIVILVTLFVVLYLVMNVSFLYNIIGKRIESLFQFIQGDEYNDASLAARSNYIELGWRKILRNPYWGYGADTFRTIAGQYAHSNFIELLFSFGIIGMIYYIPFLHCVVKFIKNARYYFASNREVVLLAVGIIVAVLLCDVFRVTYYERIALIPLNIAILTIVYYNPYKQGEK